MNLAPHIRMASSAMKQMTRCTGRALAAFCLLLVPVPTPAGAAELMQQLPPPAATEPEGYSSRVAWLIRLLRRLAPAKVVVFSKFKEGIKHVAAALAATAGGWIASETRPHASTESPNTAKRCAHSSAPDRPREQSTSSPASGNQRTSAASAAGRHCTNAAR